jgi:cellulose synthase/poly-beta-1,6-N-acetylglucosamine synthase-like glycosyltransferase
MKITILIPCHNEEKSIKECISSCLNQTVPPYQILVVNDGSTDGSAEALKSFGDKIDVITIPVATGNKSHAQERGIPHIKGEVFIATDGDTILDEHMVAVVVKAFTEQPGIVAVCGYVMSLENNWLTACREIEYVIGQNLYKVAQAYLDAIFVIPGCAGAFKTKEFREVVKFDHDTLTEDLDFTYKFHELGMRIAYSPDMIAYTQDPNTLHSYVNQMRRWYAGGWQNLRKHFGVMRKPNNVFQLSLNYIEGFIFSIAFFVAPIINLRFLEYFLPPFFMSVMVMGAIAALIRKRWDLLYYSPTYIVLVYLNAYLFLEQFFVEVVLRKSNLVWFQPERRSIDRRKVSLPWPHPERRKAIT